MGPVGWAKVLTPAVLICAAILMHAWLARPRVVTFERSYQAVLLTNNSVYFGKLSGYGTENPVLSEVYYVQTGVDPQTKQQSNILTKRGKEWHEPDKMYLNPRQILFVESVGPDSRVAQLIRELRNK